MDLIKMYNNAGATLCRIIQQAEETFLDISRTTYTEEYLNNIKKVEFVRIITEKLIADAEVFLETNSIYSLDGTILSGVVETTEKRTPIEDFGQSLQTSVPGAKEYSPLLDRDLSRIGKYQKKLGQAHKAFQTKATEQYIVKLKKIIDVDLKKFKDEELTLENLRLDHDYLKNRIDNAFTVAGRDAMEKEYEKVRVVFDKYYDSTMEYFKTIDNYFILHRKLLKEFIDTQRNYYKECDKNLTNLMRKLYNDSYRITYDLQVEQQGEGFISTSDVDEKIPKKKVMPPSKLADTKDKKEPQHDKLSSVLRNQGLLLHFHRDNKIGTITENENTPSPKCNGSIKYTVDDDNSISKLNVEKENSLHDSFIDPHDGDVCLTLQPNDTSLSFGGGIAINTPNVAIDADSEGLQRDPSLNIGFQMGKPDFGFHGPTGDATLGLDTNADVTVGGDICGKSEIELPDLSCKGDATLGLDANADATVGGGICGKVELPDLSYQGDATLGFNTNTDETINGYVCGNNKVELPDFSYKGDATLGLDANADVTLGGDICGKSGIELPDLSCKGDATLDLDTNADVTFGGNIFGKSKVELPGFSYKDDATLGLDANADVTLGGDICGKSGIELPDLSCKGDATLDLDANADVTLGGDIGAKIASGFPDLSYGGDASLGLDINPDVTIGGEIDDATEHKLPDLSCDGDVTGRLGISADLTLGGDIAAAIDSELPDISCTGDATLGLDANADVTVGGGISGAIESDLPDLSHKGDATLGLDVNANLDIAAEIETGLPSLSYKGGAARGLDIDAIIGSDIIDENESESTDISCSGDVTLGLDADTDVTVGGDIDSKLPGLSYTGDATLGLDVNADVTIGGGITTELPDASYEDDANLGLDVNADLNVGGDIGGKVEGEIPDVSASANLGLDLSAAINIGGDTEKGFGYQGDMSTIKEEEPPSSRGSGFKFKFKGDIFKD